MTKRVILDTNVLLNRLLLPDSNTARAVRRFLDRAQPIVSEETLTELAETLLRPKFDPFAPRPDRFARRCGELRGFPRVRRSGIHYRARVER